jgi:regulator of extracellular matrix RemA (YlzA/DUF370 family)
LNSELINVGLDNLVAKDEIVVIARPDSAPVKRLIAAYERENRVINLTRGRRTRAVLFTASGYVVLTPLRPKTLAERYLSEEGAVP